MSPRGPDLRAEGRLPEALTVHILKAPSLKTLRTYAYIGMPKSCRVKRGTGMSGSRSIRNIHRHLLSAALALMLLTSGMPLSTALGENPGTDKDSAPSSTVSALCSPTLVSD